MKIGFIGAGKVGFSLGMFFVQGGISVTGYYSRHPRIGPGSGANDWHEAVRVLRGIGSGK